MSEPAINVQGLSKEYVLGLAKEQPRTLYELVGGVLSRRKASSQAVAAAAVQRFNALSNVSFDVQPGEVMGVIGRNGAGKSTLLKILSRITAPTTGRVKVRGRLASLLEVGTGFHPELSGRENIFLNGAILGMSRREVALKYDEIVAFAEVEKFIDTPVKRYSSGMYVRLAFAVAAHLEPDVLIIDEVLAVGDAAFQAKCLGKINSVASGGRTVLFVSHNMQAVQSMCSRCLYLEQGEVLMLGSPSAAISQYLASGASGTASEWSSPEGIGSSELRLTRIAARSAAQTDGAATCPSNAAIVIELDVALERAMSGLCVGFDLIDARGTIVLRSYQTDVRPQDAMDLHAGRNTVRCTIPPGLLNGGDYAIAPRIGIHNREWIVNSDPLAGFSVLLNHGESPYWNSLDENTRPGVVAPILAWSLDPHHADALPTPAVA